MNRKMTRFALRGEVRRARGQRIARIGRGGPRLLGQKARQRQRGEAAAATVVSSSRRDKRRSDVPFQ